jgi:transcriptional regulator GlxA family with amidase domain
MKNVVILVPESAVLQAIADPQYCLSAVNQFLTTSGKAPLFNVQLVGCTKGIQFNGGQYTVHADCLLEEAMAPDLIIIPALFGDMEAAIALNKTMLPWIVAQHQKGAEVASLCVGAFLLAATGLLDGKKCSPIGAIPRRLSNSFRPWRYKQAAL